MKNNLRFYFQPVDKYQQKLVHEWITQPHIDEVHLDPEISNQRAVHVYKKAGFHFVEGFIASWHPVPHYKMLLNMRGIAENGC